MPARIREYFCVTLCRITRMLLIFYLILHTFGKKMIKYFLKGGKILACSLQVWKSKQGEMKWTICNYPPAKQGEIKVLWWSPKRAVRICSSQGSRPHSATEGSWPGCITASDIHVPTFLLFSGKQSAGGTEDPWSDVGLPLGPCIQPGSSDKSGSPELLPSLCTLEDAFQLLLHDPLIKDPLSCLLWFEETSDSLFALPEASLFLLVIVIWKPGLFPAGDTIIISAPSCCEITCLHPS